MCKLKLPKHEAGLTLEHNEHKNVYETVAQCIEQNPEYYDRSWVSEEQKAKAIATDELWTMHWYPRTPVTFHVMHAADIEVLLEAVAALDVEFIEIAVNSPGGH